MKKRILILSSSQFGYLTDTLKYCEHASEIYDITYVGWDYNRKKIHVPGVTVKYVSRKSNKLVRNIKLLHEFHKEIQQGYDLIFVNYLRGISIVKALNFKENFVLDIRTLSVHPSKIRRVFYDLMIKCESILFKNISVISDGVAQKLSLKKYYLLPLGGEHFTTQSKCFKNLSLLYVGTLQNRKMLECVKGFHLFLNTLQDKESNKPLFTIIGDTPDYELEEIDAYVKCNKLENNIHLKGHIPQHELSPFFEVANVGVSFIPMLPHFEYQPPTKTYEYLISGLTIIATATHANKSILKDGVGVLIDDSALSFSKGIHKINEQKQNFNSDNIRKLYADYSWKNIVMKIFVPLIEAIT